KKTETHIRTRGSEVQSQNLVKLQRLKNFRSWKASEAESFRS
ncbi:hypothetical protein A2U01_0090256, partial [Trifolium medium]|nr:hypothetical protein [Trifolium medium]